MPESITAHIQIGFISNMAKFGMNRFLSYLAPAILGVALLNAWGAHAEISENFRLHACFSIAETRDKIIADTLTNPFLIMKMMEKELHADAVSVKLCNYAGQLVYEIALLQSDGHLVSFYANAHDGKPYLAEIKN